jgi:hypothetical protein
MPPPCTHEDLYFYACPATEAGWKCASCDFRPGEPPGFSPEHDRSRIRMKVMGLLLDLHNHELVCVSNGSHGDGLEEMVAVRCEREERFDQYSILLFLLEAMTPSHAEYWKKISKGVLTGNDPRHRCACGALSCVSVGAPGETSGWKYFCGDCHSKETKGEPF